MANNALNKLGYAVVKQMALAIAPESLTFLSEDKKYTIQEFKESIELKKLIQPGDLILTQTPGPFHASIRKIYNLKYDHLAIAIDNENIFHVAPPAVRLLNMNILLMKKRYPLILRLNIPKEDIQNILSKLMSYIGNPYDYLRILMVASNIIIYRVLQFEPNFSFNSLDKTSHTICSDLITCTILENSQLIKEFIREHFKQLDVSQYGSFSTDDFKKMNSISSSLVQVIHETPTIRQQDHGVASSLPTYKIFASNVLCSYEIVRKVRNLIKQPGVKNKFILTLKIFKFLVLQDKIPCVTTLIENLVPLNKTLIDIVIIMLKIREFNKPRLKTNIGIQLVMRAFPIVFYITNQLATKEELELLFSKIEEHFKTYINQCTNKLFVRKSKL